MAKDKKKNDTGKNAKPKKQDSKLAKDSASKKGKGASKGGPVTEKKPNIFGKLFEYLVGVRAELKRVTWPSREKVIYLVGVVAVTLVFFSVFTALVDWGSSEGVVRLNELVHGVPEGGTNQIPVELDFGDFDGINDATIDEGIVGDVDGSELDVDGDVDADSGNGDTDEADE